MSVLQLYAVPLPMDNYAERSLAGCALAAVEAPALAMGRVRVDDFHDRRCWRVIEACARIPHLRNLDERIAFASHVAGVEPGVLRKWHEHRTVFADTNGVLARRVTAASTRRRRVLELAAELEQLGARPVGIAA